MRTLIYEGFQITKENCKKTNDALVVEAALQININKEPYTVVMRTPGDDYQLVRGLLYAEDIYKKSENFSYEIIEKLDNGFSIINIHISKKHLGKGYLNKRTLLSISSCGICGKQKIEDITVTGEKLIANKSFNTKNLKRMFSEMKAKQETFDLSGGSHAAALYDENTDILAIKEDIGRHNAVDKVIGQLIIDNSLHKAKYMLVSGRVSYEIISKAFIAKIPIVVAVSACSTLAVDFAKEFGITLIGFSRGKKATVYSNL